MDCKIFNLLFNSYYFGIILLIAFSDFALFAFRFNGHFYSVEAICSLILCILLDQNTL